LIYLDTSAFLKTVFEEPESGALQAYLDGHPDAPLVSSSLLVVEARRVEQRAISAAVIESAGRLPDPHLRSPDAIHLATALLIRNDVDVVLTYDTRLREAADSHGLATAAPA